MMMMMFILGFLTACVAVPLAFALFGFITHLRGRTRGIGDYSTCDLGETIEIGERSNAAVMLEGWRHHLIARRSWHRAAWRGNYWHPANRDIELAQRWQPDCPAHPRLAMNRLFVNEEAAELVAVQHNKRQHGGTPVAAATKL